MNPSGTDIRRMLAKARAKQVAEVVEGVKAQPWHPETAYAMGVEAALAWVLGERKEPPVA